MGLNLKKVYNNSNKSREADVDAGVYPGRLVQVIDLGVQPQRPYKGEPKKPIQEAYLTYELADEFLHDEDGNELKDKPRWYSETVPVNSLKSDLAKSTKRYKALDPDIKYGGDFTQTLGRPVMITLVHNQSATDASRVFANIAATSTVNAKQAAKMPELVNKPRVFDLDSPDLEVFNELPEWLQDKIKSNLHFSGSKLDKLLGGKGVVKAAEPEAEDDGDEIPW